MSSPLRVAFKGLVPASLNFIKQDQYAIEDPSAVHTCEVDLRDDWKSLKSGELCAKLEKLGYKIPDNLTIVDRPVKVQIVDKDSESSYDVCSDAGLCIRENQTFADWYTHAKGGHEEPNVKSDGKSVSVYGTTIGFERTLRVPDTDKSSRLPPSLGRFPLEPVKDHIDKLPELVVARGGYILPMFQREALWLSFRHASQSSNAMKVSVGGINALTGQLKGQPGKAGVQDYLCRSQPWLDGIVKEEGSVRQFVAMPINEGYTIEEQITGKNTEATLQLDVFPGYPQEANFTVQQQRVDKIWSTPLDVGAKAGETVTLNIRNCDTSLTIGQMARLYGPVISFSAEYKPHLIRSFGSTRGMSRGSRGGPVEESCLMDSFSMGLASGGSIKQQIDRDLNDTEMYDFAAGKRIFIHFINAGAWKEMTGRPAETPVDKSAYRKQKLPWFELYNEPEPAKGLRAGFSQIKSVNDIDTSGSGTGRVQVDDDEKTEDEKLFSQRWEKSSGKIVGLDHGKIGVTFDGKPPFIHATREEKPTPIICMRQDHGKFNDDVSRLTK